MSVADDIRMRIADDLARAEQSGVAVDPPTASHPDLDVVDAYEIQLINIRRRLDAGARIAGHKVGLASEAMQQMMGVDEPDYGHLLDTMQYHEGTPIDASTFCFPRVEVEVGFLLGEDLPGANCTNGDVIDAVAAVVPSIELIDSRIRDWRITGVRHDRRQRVVAGVGAGSGARGDRRDRRRRHRRGARAQRRGRREGQFVGGAGQSVDRGGVAGPQGHLEAGACKLVGGQEDQLIDIALELKKKQDANAGV